MLLAAPACSYNTDVTRLGLLCPAAVPFACSHEQACSASGVVLSGLLIGLVPKGSD